ncbi:hypothetical protein BURK2_01552 [Burkholderiales bacterium]|nr:hypothetical protein BURK2_01552 [Burkholderiales bacterium]
MNGPETKTSWPVHPIAELLERVRRPVEVELEETYQEIGIRSHCKGIFHKPPTTGKVLGQKRVFWVEPGCLVFNIVFAWEQAVAMTSDEEDGMIASHRFPMYRGRDGRMLAEYAWRYFSTVRGKHDLGIASPGGAGRNKTLGQDELAHLRIPVPPIQHQQLVVEVLGSTDRAVEAIEALLQAKRCARDGLAEHLLSGRLRASGSTGEWKTRRLGDVSQVSKGAGASKAELAESGLPVVRYGELYGVYGARIDETRSHISPDAARQSRRIQQGDILLAGSGEDRREIGMAAAYMGRAPAYAGGDTIIVTPSGLHSVFLAYLLRSSTVRREFFRRAQGESVVHLYMRDVEALELMLPPFEEQARIASVIESADREISLLSRKAAAFRLLKTGLAQRLLDGGRLDMQNLEEAGR